MLWVKENEIIKKITSLGALVLALSGCSNGIDTDKGNFNGYPITVKYTAHKTEIKINGLKWSEDGRAAFQRDEVYLTGVDTNLDGRIDFINLDNVPKGDSLEKYACLDSLEKAQITAKRQQAIFNY
ncbi:hypothetical protein HY498_05305 [Candidatus Woesearchaeota archaeon]|nr:hypothetical protein [Candidatus Woesearchaeota archaeon]